MVHDFAGFAAVAHRFDLAVRQTPEVDRFCSSSAWVLSAREAFHPGTTPFVFELDTGWAALMIVDTPTLGRCVFPLEASWGFACGMVGPDPRSVVRDLVAVLRASRDRWDALFLLGLKRDGLAFRELVRSFASRTLGIGRPTGRCVASLLGGEDGFLSRRSAGFRANLRRSDRRSAAAGVLFERLAPTGKEEALRALDRVVAVEARSWKGLADSGMRSERMLAFYEAMFPRLAEEGSLRVGWLHRDGRDVGFVAGASRDGIYRGLQVSYADEEDPALSLGNVAQLHMIRWLIEEGCHTYDLGQDMPYKHRWAESFVETVALVVR